jgi:hypothetical protein
MVPRSKSRHGRRPTLVGPALCAPSWLAAARGVDLGALGRLSFGRLPASWPLTGSRPIRTAGSCGTGSASGLRRHHDPARAAIPHKLLVVLLVSALVPAVRQRIERLPRGDGQTAVPLRRGRSSLRRSGDRPAIARLGSRLTVSGWAPSVPYIRFSLCRRLWSRPFSILNPRPTTTEPEMFVRPLGLSVSASSPADEYIGLQTTPGVAPDLGFT